MFIPTDTHKLVLLGVHKQKSYRAIADEIGSSLHWVSLLLDALEEEGYVRNQAKQKKGNKIVRVKMNRPNILTEKGLELLRKERLLHD